MRRRFVREFEAELDAIRARRERGRKALIERGQYAGGPRVHRRYGVELIEAAMELRLELYEARFGGPSPWPVLPTGVERRQEVAVRRRVSNDNGAGRRAAPDRMARRMRLRTGTDASRCDVRRALRSQEHGGPARLHPDTVA